MIKWLSLREPILFSSSNLHLPDYYHASPKKHPHADLDVCMKIIKDHTMDQ